MKKGEKWKAQILMGGKQIYLGTYAEEREAAAAYRRAAAARKEGRLGEHVAVVKGDISGPEPVVVRMHALNILDDLLHDLFDAMVQSGKGGMDHSGLLTHLEALNNITGN